VEGRDWEQNYKKYARSCRNRIRAAEAAARQCRENARACARKIRAETLKEELLKKLSSCDLDLLSSEQLEHIMEVLDDDY